MYAIRSYYGIYWIAPVGKSSVVVPVTRREDHIRTYFQLFVYLVVYIQVYIQLFVVVVNIHPFIGEIGCTQTKLRFIVLTTNSEVGVITSYSIHYTKLYEK